MALTRLCVLAVAAYAQLASAQKQPPGELQALSRQFQALVDRVKPAVVQITTRGYAGALEDGGATVRTRTGSGSGVIVDAEGYVLTNAHVVGSVRNLHVLLPPSADDRAMASILKPAGKLVPAQVIGMDREADIAVVKIEAKGLPFLRFADSENLRQGHLVFAFGSPFGLENSVTMGVVSSVARQVQPDHPMIYIQTDASINPGNSGGPLVDAEGQMVGVNTFIVSQTSAGNSVGFAVPSNIVRTVYDQIRQHGRVRRGQIGVQLQTITPALAQALGLQRDWGALVADVAPSSAAQAGGLEIKDIVLSLNGKTIENARQFGVNIYQNAGKTVAVEVLRGSEKRTLQIAVLERPRDPDRILTEVTGEQNLVPRLGILSVDLNEKVTPLLGSLRKLSGVVVAGVVADLTNQGDAFLPGDVIYAVNNTAVRSLDELKTTVQSLKPGPVAIQIERLGQLQFLVFDLQ